jgi:hypothetical protein
MTNWRVLSPSAQLIIEPAFRRSRHHQGHLCQRGIPISLERHPLGGVSPDRGGRTGGLARARSVAEEALDAYAEDWLGLLGGRAEVVSSNP